MRKAKPAPTTRVLAALARTSHLLQLHFVVFWGLFAGTSHAFQRGSGCPARGIFGRGAASSPLLRARPSSLRSTLQATSGVDTSGGAGGGEHPRAGHSCAVGGSGLRMHPSALLRRGGELQAQASSRLYMALHASPPPVSLPISKHADKQVGKYAGKQADKQADKHAGKRGRVGSSLSLEGALRSKRSDARQHLPEVVVIGVSHRHCPVEVRERLAIPEEQWNAASAQLCAAPSIDEAFVLSTCNRFEVYVAGKNEYEAMTDALQYLHASTNGTVAQETLRRHMFVLTGEDAISHLMRVSAGLDSMVLGEAQIQCQVKKAYTRSCQEDGSSGLVLRRMLESALLVGRRVRSETDICKGAVSVSSAAVEFTNLKMQQQAQQRHSEQALADLGIGEQAGEETVLPAKSLANSNIVVVGAGKMARLLLIHLNSKKVRAVTVVNRSPESVQRLREEFRDMHIQYVPMEQMWGAVQEADVVYPCTSSAAPLITPRELQQCMDARLEKRRLVDGAAVEADVAGCGAACPASLPPPSAVEASSHSRASPPPFTPQLPLRFVDLSVPRNVHPSCASEVRGVECFNVDDLKEVVQQNTARRQGEARRAEGIIREELQSYQRWQDALGALPTITRLQQKAEEMRLQELQRYTGRLAQLSPDELKAVDMFSRGVVGKLLSGPMQHLRATADGREGESADTAAAVSQVQKAFHSMLEA